MPVWTAVKGGKALMFELQIIRILTLSGDETNVFRPADGLDWSEPIRFGKMNPEKPASILLFKTAEQLPRPFQHRFGAVMPPSTSVSSTG